MQIRNVMYHLDKNNALCHIRFLSNFFFLALKTFLISDMI